MNSEVESTGPKHTVDSAKQFPDSLSYRSINHIGQHNGFYLNRTFITSCLFELPYKRGDCDQQGRTVASDGIVCA